MGQIIEKLALEKGHEIVARYNSTHPFNHQTIRSADVAIEFSNPELATKHIQWCVDQQVPLVTGTTGWYAEYDTIKQYCTDHAGSLFTATNFSLGVNLFFEMSKRITRLMNQQPYTTSILEIHHTEKKDAPSGTAITLAENVIESSSSLTNWILTTSDQIIHEVDSNTLPIQAQRIPGVPGTHVLQFESEVDIIKLEHEAKSRLGFATGAVVAAEWLYGKTGVFGMRDLLNFEN